MRLRLSTASRVNLAYRGFRRHLAAWRGSSRVTVALPPGGPADPVAYPPPDDLPQFSRDRGLGFGPGTSCLERQQPERAGSCTHRGSPGRSMSSIETTPGHSALPAPPILWTQEQTAEALGVSVRYLRDSSCPKVLLPGNGRQGQPLVRYFPEDVRAWAMNWRQHRSGEAA